MVTCNEKASAADIDNITALFSEPYDKHDVYTFNFNGTYIRNDAGAPCSFPGDENRTGEYREIQ